MIVDGPFEAKDWLNKNAYYQVLLVEPYNNPLKDNNPLKGKYIKTTILTAKRGDSSPVVGDDEKTFFNYKIDNYTKENLETNQASFGDYIGNNLPSCGVVLPEQIIELLFPNNFLLNQPVLIGLNNVYDKIRTLLYTRKISQLIAKTWWTYLAAKKENSLWKQFTEGKWHEIIENPDNSSNYNMNILDGLIAREIFLLDPGVAPDYLDPPNLDIYYPLHTKERNISEKTNTLKDEKELRFLIFPDTKAWQGIALSLLMAGQAYYPVTENNEIRYHQICQPILSTGDIILKYAVDVSWNDFKGVQHELIVSPVNNSTFMQVIAPYPPIPSEENLAPEDIKKWADAKDDVSYESQENPDPHKNEEFPFYVKDKEKYLVDVKYFSPPYPYIPLSCC